MRNLVNGRKCAMIGCGFVGSTAAYTLMQTGIFNEIVLIDVDKDRAEGEALDITQGIPFAKPCKVYAGNYDDAADALVAVVSAGANQKPGETRLELAQKNTNIFKSIMPELVERNFGGVILVLTNPVEILTRVTIDITGFSPTRVIGSGTVLDTARLKQRISALLDVNSRNVHAHVVGEHGDSEVVLWSKANVFGIPIKEFCEMRGCENGDFQLEQISADVKNSAYEIINKKKATYYAIAQATKRICQAIVRDEKSLLTVSHMQNGSLFEGTVLSMPAIVGKYGAEFSIPAELSDHEKGRLIDSAKKLNEVYATLEI
ncbi:MAG: L-lactate dehydrogenase [Phoenicibacter congonensis]|uniref:L-lactate dehydrogenase n=1 Tax=Phoenicibacter congonensis TaxID=1944646 RepID=A0AA43RJY2_9ACTN|nr:L-lactate dehydrogenase [Phoenicibacter congonensis]